MLLGKVHRIGICQFKGNNLKKVYDVGLGPSEGIRVKRKEDKVRKGYESVTQGGGPSGEP